MEPYSLQSEFTDAVAEQALLASIAQHPVLYWELRDILTSDVFTSESESWRSLAVTIEADQQVVQPNLQPPAKDPRATAMQLVDLYQRRQLAGLQEQFIQALYDPDIPAANTAARLSDEAFRLYGIIQRDQARHVQWSADLISHVLEEAQTRYERRLSTGQAVMGIPSGIPRLDTMLGGLKTGLYLLGGPPGMGKTTLALHLAVQASRTFPVLFVTFENTPESLMLKALCSQAKVNPQQVQRGYVDPVSLQAPAMQWQTGTFQLGFVEGSSTLTVSQLRAHALKAMQQSSSPTCLLIVDYLQLWGKVWAELPSVTSVRERIERLGALLRELAMQLRSPVLALSSQNRAAGNYGNGKGAAALDSLKESGDLEYAADAVLFLTAANLDERHAIPPNRALDLTVAKHRDGETGKVHLIFRPDIGTIGEEAHS